MKPTPSLAKESSSLVDGEEVGHSPQQILRQLAVEHDPSLRAELNRVYWQLLTFATVKKREPSSPDLIFSFPDRLHFDFGIWCGEQFANDNDVQEFLAHYDKNQGSPWPMVYEECCDQIKVWSSKPPFYTITEWLKQREENYRLCAEAENFVVPPEVLKKLPQSSNRYISLRDERRTLFEQLKAFMEKAPGLHDKLIQLIVSGSLHDQIDFMKVRPQMSQAQKNKLFQVQQLWEDTSAKLRRLFKHPKLLGYIDRIETISTSIQQLIVRYKINVNAVLLEAKNLYINQSYSNKRLNRDLLLLKNNLNMGSAKHSGRLYDAIPQEWPKPVDLAELESARQRSLKFDRCGSESTPIILAPGLKNGFYEFDQGALILPLYSQDPQKDYFEAMAERHFTIVMLKNGSTMISELEQIIGEEKKLPKFKEIYSNWILDAEKSEPLNLNLAEYEFALKHIAPPLEQLFLRDEEFILDQQHMLDLLSRWKLGKLPPQHHRKVAAIFFNKERFKEAALVLENLALIFPDEPEIEIPMILSFERADMQDDKDAILNKWSKEKNLGYYGRLAGLAN